MSHSPLVSVIIPNYMRTSQLRKSLQSVFDQDYSNYEILVVDDCSPNAREVEGVVSEFNDDRMRFFKHQTNQGGGGARNTGIKNAKGQYIAFLDSDDVWHPQKLSLQVRSALSAINPDRTLVYCRATLNCRMKSYELPLQAIGQHERVSDYLFVHGGFIGTPCIFVSKMVAENCLFDATLKRHQDFDFLFKAEKYGVDFEFIDKSLVEVDWIDNDVVKKGWSAAASISFVNSNRKSFSSIAYTAFCFEVKCVSQAIHGPKLLSLLEYLFMIGSLNRIKPSQHCKFFARLLFDWRFVRRALGFLRTL